MSDHYYSKEQESPFKPAEFDVEFNSKRLHFISGSGVFCIGKIDDCSDILIRYCDIKDGQSILDLGCGFGPVGICLLTKYPTLLCDFTDVNKRAAQLTHKNLRANNIDNSRYHVYTGDGYEKVNDKQYDVILLNPPQSAGRQLCNQLIADAKSHLVAGGSIQIVARHNKGGAMFEKFMTECFGNCDALAKKGGVRVYKSVNTA